MLGALLLFAAQLITAVVPVPPASPVDLLAWVADHLRALQAANELRMFASVLLLAGLIGVARTRGPAMHLELLALAAFTLAITISAVAVLVEGRLAYPILGLQLSAATAGLVVSSLYGAFHAVSVMCAIGVLAATLAALRGGAQPVLAWAGAAAAVAQLLGAFPWLMPAWVSVIAAVTLLIWTFAAVHLLTGRARVLTAGVVAPVVPDRAAQRLGDGPGVAG